MTYEPSKNTNKEIGIIIKENQRKIVELKNTSMELKNSLIWQQTPISIRKKISKNDDQSYKFIESEEQKGKQWSKVYRVYITYRTASSRPTYVLWHSQETTEKRAESLSEEIMAKNLPNVKTMIIYIQEVLTNSKRDKSKKTILQHIISQKQKRTLKAGKKKSDLFYKRDP